MKESLLNLINCPVCGKNFTLKTFKEDERGIIEGLLLCSCGQSFPIIKNIPRILIGDLKTIIYEQFPDFFVKYKDFLSDKEQKEKQREDSLKKRKTAESFGYEWQKFSGMFKEWEKNFKFYFEPLGDIGLLRGKMVLEVGCGKGRHTFYAAKIAKEIIAVDFSSAIDVAFSNNKDATNVHFIQADIYNLPFKENFFDFIYSIGVLHHLPDPEAGFKKLLDLLKIEGGILIYVYHKFSKKILNYHLLKIVNIVRGITTKIPHNLLYIICYPVAFISYLVFVLPYKIFFNKKNIKNWPLKTYSQYPFKVLLNDTFDRFSAPIENRYSKEEILKWYQDAGLKNIKILGGAGWRVFGEKHFFNYVRNNRDL